ncbi:hypothetical protein INT45_007620 [Circinella minor]|uniref:Uncharacterized protein n=1 Tax=Circinella minor TaxID=1195481 RepID=A0A8H7RZY1_9FUNG|nr:hypothetical protein INT45_007620 [Circinella minor]
MTNKHRPGTDETRKTILKHPIVKISLRTVAILDVIGDNYRVGDTEWPDGTRSDVLYELLDRSLKQAPIIIEVQRTVVNANFMLRAVYYCIMSYHRYQVLPILQSTPAFAPPACANLPVLHHHWFLEMLKILNETATCNLHQEVLRKNIDREQQLLNAINCACDVGVKHYQQILETAERLQYDSPCIQDEALLGILKLKQVKRSVDDANLDEEVPENSQLVSQDEERFKNTMDFVKRYKETRNRMNWRGCHSILEKTTQRYPLQTSEVLRTVYNRFKARS